MAKIRKKETLEENVYEMALQRTRYIFESFDKIVVSFSGGKDSTAVLNVALEVAKEKGKLPLEVVFFDEEAIHPPTIEYVRRVSQMPEVDLKWYCLEFKHRNASSNEEPFWYTWEKGKEDLWTRELPKEAITEHPKFYKGLTFQEFSPMLYPISDGKIAMLTGIRTEESLRRYRVIAMKKNDAYLNTYAEKGSNQYRAFPVYDWSSDDVWLAVHKFGWDYNKTYDIFNQTSMYGNFLKQRVCPPFGEEPLRGLWIYSECFPEMWHKMLYRVKGVSTAWRYANTELYSNAQKKPDGLTYKEYLKVILDSYDHDYQVMVKRTINTYIKRHKNLTKQNIDDEQAHPVSGLSWRWLCKVAIRGDFKGRQSSDLDNEAIKAQDKLGITKEQAIKMFQ